MMLGHRLCHLFLNPLVKIKKIVVSPNVWINSELLQPSAKAHDHKWHIIFVPVTNNTEKVLLHRDANFSKRFAKIMWNKFRFFRSKRKILIAS